MAGGAGRAGDQFPAKPGHRAAAAVVAAVSPGDLLDPGEYSRSWGPPIAPMEASR